MRALVAALLGATVFASGAAGMATGAGDTGRLALPTYSQAYAPTTVDERGAWMEADEDERRLRESPSVIRDLALNAYVRGVLCRTVGDDRCRSVRIYIERVPAFNASMAPNGTMIVWSGLLLRVRNEAELGAILGHEFGHFELRHSVLGFRNQRSGTDLMAWASILIRNSGDIQSRAGARGRPDRLPVSRAVLLSGLGRGRRVGPYHGRVRRDGAGTQGQGAA